MSVLMEGRISDSPYIHMVWRGQTFEDYSPVCPADSHWNFLFLREKDHVRVTFEGPTTQAIYKNQYKDREFLVIQFALGTYMPKIPARTYINTDALLPEAASQNKFWINDSVWQLPDFDNAEVFVERLVREGILVTDPIVHDVLQDQVADLSARSVRRRFLQATGIPRKTIEQIDRAKLAMTLITQGVSILDTVYETGYADQAHLTRSLKHYTGLTPAQLVPKIAE